MVVLISNKIADKNPVICHAAEKKIFKLKQIFKLPFSDFK